MERGFALPGWGRSHYRFVLVVTLTIAVILRISYHESVVESDAVDRHLPVAAAIGLYPEVPQDAALSAWVNSGLYSVALSGLSLTYPGLSPVDVGVAFLKDPEGFSALARFAAMVALAASVYVTFLLVSALVDRPTAVAAAFVLAVHPTAIAFTAGIDSGAFCLLFMLSGLLVAARLDWREARPVEFAAIGLTLGFAVDAIPYVAIIFALVLIVAIRRTPRQLRSDLAANVAISIACFCVTAALVIPSIAATPATARAALAGAIVIAALVAARYALQSLRQLLGPDTYSAAVLSMGLAVGLVASMTLADDGPGAGDTPASLASHWIVEHLPGDSVVIVHSRLADAVSLPRNARSWQRELGGADNPRAQLTLDRLVATHNAIRSAGPQYDVVASVCDRSLAHLLSHSGHASGVHYMVLPEDIDPTVIGSPEEFWLVALFRSSSADAPGVAIWGTQASPHVTPIHVEWIQTSKHMLSALQSPAS